jgi:ATP-dependent exoDNAse (exonuclease V) beta subunit
MAINLTEEQRAVVEADAKSLLVSASAGSGKTTVLVERYLRHLFQDGLTPSSVWAVTFTHKAATEMRGRILEALRLRGRFDLMEEAETGPIGTLDGLCERLLRENAIEARLDPQYRVLGNDDLARLRSDSIKEAIATVDEKRSNRGAAQGVAPGLQALELLEVELQELDSLEGNLAGESAWRQQGPHSELLRQINEFINDFRNGKLSADDLEARYGHRDRVLEAWHRSAISVQGVNPVFEAEVQGAVGTEGFWTTLRRVFSSKEVPRWMGGKHDFARERKEAEHTARLVRIGCSAWRIMEAAMLRRSELDFSFQQRLVLKLLSESETVRRRVGSTVRAVMVDEAQDLNPLQFMLLAQFQAALGREGFVTLVGDSKQSIYGFRQASPQQFDALAQRWTSLSLTRNHRSELGIQRYVDSWSQVALPNYQPMTDRPGPFEGVEIQHLAAWTPDKVAAKIAALVDEGCKPGQIAVLSDGWADVTQVGEELTRLGIKSQATGSRSHFHAHLTVRDLAATLRALVDPTDDLAYLTVLRSPMADLSLDGIVELALMAQPDQAQSAEPTGDPAEKPDPKPLSQIEYEPRHTEDLAKYEKFSAWFEPLQKEAGRLPAWEVLSAILAESGYLETMASRLEGKEAIANARKLLRMACEKPTLSAAEFALQVRKIQQLDFKDQDSDVERDEDAVVLSTVHSAKGLEFETVVVARPSKIKDSASKDRLEIDLMGERLATGQDGSHPTLELIRAIKKINNSAEAHRKVYVALTRAKRRLIVFVEDKTAMGASLEAASDLSSMDRRSLRVLEGGKGA